jgi:hypothetical protein
MCYVHAVYAGGWLLLTTTAKLWCIQSMGAAPWNVCSSKQHKHNHYSQLTLQASFCKIFVAEAANPDSCCWR